MAGKVKLPEENVEYTFYLKNQATATYIYIGLNDKDRVVLMNVKNKKFITMTPTYFSYMRKNRCASQIKTEKYKEPIKSIKGKEKSCSESTEEYEKRIIRELRELTPALCLSLMAHIGQHPNSLANELELLQADKDDKYPQPFVNRVFTNLMKAQDFLRDFNNKDINNII